MYQVLNVINFFSMFANVRNFSKYLLLCIVVLMLTFLPVYNVQKLETNTFQVIYVTDGTTAYATTIYKKGSMTWLFEDGRTINVGFLNDQQKRDYGVTYTDLTTKMDKITWNTGHINFLKISY